MTIEVALHFSDEDLQFFRDAMKGAIDAASKLDESEIIEKATVLCKQMEETRTPDFVKEKMAKLQKLIAMLSDDEWQLPEEERKDILTSMAYFCEFEDLVPDDIPILGYIDDAIMIELVASDLSENINSYREFCSFRKTEENRRGADANVTRESWLAGKRRELHSAMRARRASRSRIF